MAIKCEVSVSRIFCSFLLITCIETLATVLIFRLPTVQFRVRCGKLYKQPNITIKLPEKKRWKIPAFFFFSWQVEASILIRDKTLRIELREAAQISFTVNVLNKMLQSIIILVCHYFIVSLYRRAVRSEL